MLGKLLDVESDVMLNVSIIGTLDAIASVDGLLPIILSAIGESIGESLEESLGKLGKLLRMTRWGIIWTAAVELTRLMELLGASDGRLLGESLGLSGGIILGVGISTGISDGLLPMIVSAVDEMPVAVFFTA